MDNYCCQEVVIAVDNRRHESGISCVYFFLGARDPMHHSRLLGPTRISCTAVRFVGVRFVWCGPRGTHRYYTLFMEVTMNAAQMLAQLAQMSQPAAATTVNDEDMNRDATSSATASN